ncbi:putative glycoside hydrolase [Pseudobacteriovorax antillogorgiicola]|uniref:DUF4015 domain-containing protein n=1 Tax=Pseudobacteriovorax antillogorgiicola TaxID=1513793 RepID=A0A1Y6BNV5_9BACT|nr:putative glycoside hydrolase [Pseudobacteriovorax antillogorgiicola]TCS55431.1 hypothetical protein EDD56_105152 [Pseudobacteriovorax antillogorgiicola]SMF12517.1 hypothetical protein SAMN06296036_105172 [Pseudobacteriovorax antillogorgiicola]
MNAKLILRVFLVIHWFLNPDLLLAETKETCQFHNHWPDQSSSIDTFYVTPEVLYLRQGPGKGARIKDFLARNQKITKMATPLVEAPSGYWMEVIVKSPQGQQVGWVLSDFLSRDPMASTRLKQQFAKVDFSLQDKVCEFAQNPRRNVKGIYLTMYSSYGHRFDKYLKLARDTEINSFVVDVKDERGKILFKSKTVSQRHPKQAKKNLYETLDKLSAKTKADNIYLIGKLVVFKDDSYARTFPESAIRNDAGQLFEDRDGLAWVSPHNRQYWNYMVGIAEEMALQGVQEIQFDYVRFPDTSKSLHYPDRQSEGRVEAIQGFLSYAYQRLKPYGVYISADVFGLVPNTSGDLYIGQHWEALSNVVDYISPMMYPSHYARGFRGLKSPDNAPYKTIYYSARDAVKRNQNIPSPATIRPWIQGFTATWLSDHLSYGPQELKEQVDALAELGVHEYLIWNPKNRYDAILNPVQQVAEVEPMAAETPSGSKL